MGSPNATKTIEKITLDHNKKELANGNCQKYRTNVGITEIHDISSLYFESELLVIIIWYQIKIKPIGIIDWANHEGINGEM